MPKRGRPRIQVTRLINIIEVDAEIKLAMKEHDPQYLERLQALKYLAQKKAIIFTLISFRNFLGSFGYTSLLSSDYAFASVVFSHSY